MLKRKKKKKKRNWNLDAEKRAIPLFMRKKETETRIRSHTFSCSGRKHSKYQLNKLSFSFPNNRKSELFCFVHRKLQEKCNKIDIANRELLRHSEPSQLILINLLGFINLDQSFRIIIEIFISCYFSTLNL